MEIQIVPLHDGRYAVTVDGETVHTAPNYPEAEVFADEFVKA